VNAGRRTVLALLGADLLARPSWAQGRTITDSAGRKIVLPDRISRVFVAGPSAVYGVDVIVERTESGRHVVAPRY
jgi:iron complex transport system substrate-binding protein